MLFAYRRSALHLLYLYKCRRLQSVGAAALCFILRGDYLMDDMRCIDLPRQR